MQIGYRPFFPPVGKPATSADPDPGRLLGRYGFPRSGHNAKIRIAQELNCRSVAARNSLIMECEWRLLSFVGRSIPCSAKQGISVKKAVKSSRLGRRFRGERGVCRFFPVLFPDHAASPSEQQLARAIMLLVARSGRDRTCILSDLRLTKIASIDASRTRGARYSPTGINAACVSS
jgi:hypothetical protein